jgi:hypothetical protein
MESDKQIKEFKRQAELLPKKISYNDEWNINLATSEKDMEIRKKIKPITRAVCIPSLREIRILPQPNVDPHEDCLHELIHSVFNSIGYKFKTENEEEMLTRALTKMFKSYLIACSHNQVLKKLKSKKSKRKK